MIRVFKRKNFLITVLSILLALALMVLYTNLNALVSNKYRHTWDGQAMLVFFRMLISLIIPAAVIALYLAEIHISQLKRFNFKLFLWYFIPGIIIQLIPVCFELYLEYLRKIQGGYCISIPIGYLFLSFLYSDTGPIFLPHLLVSEQSGHLKI